jgi:hypothetical protein
MNKIKEESQDKDLEDNSIDKIKEELEESTDLIHLREVMIKKINKILKKWLN